MIRIVYRWNVPPENQEAFIAAWNKTTVAIRETINGAKGSELLVGQDDSNLILTIANWDELEQWRDFMKSEHKKTMSAMHSLGKFLSNEPFVLQGDHTI